MTWRPQSLVEVARRGGKDYRAYRTALDEFLDDFYLDPSVTGREKRINDAPDLDDLISETAVNIAAAAEHLSYRWQLQTPAWVERHEFMGDGEPRFYPQTARMRPILIVASPPAFRRRMVFVVAEPLGRARLPGGHRVVMPFEDGTPSDG